jgi:hypothetical protein
MVVLFTCIDGYDGFSHPTGRSHNMTESQKNGPPAQIVATTVLCGLLALPMLAAAGSLAAFAVSGNAPVISTLLATAVLATAGVNLVGAVHIVHRGAARLAQLGGYLTIGITAVMLVGLMVQPSAGVALAVPLFFLPTAIAMLALLGNRRTRLWLAARSRAFEMVADVREPARQTR